MDASSRRILVVANRTASTPLLLDAVRTRAQEGRCTFALLIPNEPRKGGADWTLETAKPLLEREAGGPVDGIVGEAEPFEAVKSALRDPGFDEVIISTLPKRVSEWLRPRPAASSREARCAGHHDHASGARDAPIHPSPVTWLTTGSPRTVRDIGRPSAAR